MFKHDFFLVSFPCSGAGTAHTARAPHVRVCCKTIAQRKKLKVTMQGSRTGVIRFMTQDHAQGMIKECNEAGELHVQSGHKFKLSMMTGDEEACIWKTIHANLAKRESDQRGKRGHPGGRNGGGSHAKRSRR